MSNKIKTEQDASQRRRGRPSGKNRVPLSLEERRARNAQYERERRTVTAEALLELADAAGCDRNISNTDLLATVIRYLQRASERCGSEPLDDLERINNNLESQIASLQSRLGIDDNSLELLDNNMENDHLRAIQESNSENDSQYGYTSQSQTKKRKRISNSAQRRKRTKLQSGAWSDFTDSGIESQSPQPESVPSEGYMIEPPHATQVPLETIEEYPTQSQIDFHSQLYRQIYSEDSESGRACNSNGLPCSNSTPSYMETLTRSLFTIPPIRPSQNDQPALTQQTVALTQHCMPEVVHFEAGHIPTSVMPTYDIGPSETFQNECENLPQIQQTFDLFTDSDRGLISEWLMNCDFLIGD